MSETIDRLSRLLVEVFTDHGASMEEDASRLREVARLAMIAAHDLDPQEEQR